MSNKNYRENCFFFRTNLLDTTLIHPESYDLAKRLLVSQGFSIKDIGSQKVRHHFSHVIKGREVKAEIGGSKSSIGGDEKDLENLDQIIEAFQTDPFIDIRDTNPDRKVNLKSELLSLQNLTVGMALDGTVKNVTHFGAFVDIGIGKDALLHQSQFHKNSIPPKLGQNIRVMVKSIEKDRQRVNLTFSK